MYKNIYIVENHQEVLRHWLDCYIENDRKGLNLIVFDFHSDGLLPFDKQAHDNLGKTKPPYESACYSEREEERIKIFNKCKNDFDSNNYSLNNYIKYVNCDEHNMLAKKLEIIDEWHSIHITGEFDDSTAVIAYKVLQEFEDTDYHDRLDDLFLITNGLVKTPLISKPYILDLDLDYFNTPSSLNPKGDMLIHELISNAEIITIAKSKVYFDELKLVDTFSVDDALKLLLNIIHKHRYK